MSSIVGPDVETQQQQQKGASSFLSQEERGAVARMFGFPEDLPGEFKEWLLDFIRVNLSQFPVGNLQGFAQTQATPLSLVSTNEGTSSTAYEDLATIGPSLVGVGSGRFVIYFGAQIITTSTDTGIVSPSINGEAPDEDDSAVAGGPGALNISVSRLTMKTLEDNNNNITLKYRRNGTGSVGFNKRWLLALRVGN